MMMVRVTSVVNTMTRQQISTKIFIQLGIAFFIASCLLDRTAMGFAIPNTCRRISSLPISSSKDIRADNGEFNNMKLRRKRMPRSSPLSIVQMSSSDDASIIIAENNEDEEEGDQKPNPLVQAVMEQKKVKSKAKNNVVSSAIRMKQKQKNGAAIEKNEKDIILNAVSTADSTTSVVTVVADEDSNDVYKKAIQRTLYWVGLSVGFGCILAFSVSPQVAGEFFSGYLLEQSLSVDNILVFLLLFDYFKVPQQYENKVLNYGIIGSIVMRATMIGAGSVALSVFEELLLVFAGIMIFTSAKMISEGSDDGEEDEDDLSSNMIVQFSKSLIGSTENFDGDNFFTTVEDGVRKATPLFLCMIAIEISDVVFAIDSVPAIFGVTKNPLIVFSSNMFAIVGLRSLYIILSKAASELKYLDKAVAALLGFIGVKLILEYFAFGIPTALSLEIIIATLGVGVFFSLLDIAEGMDLEELYWSKQQQKK